MNPANLLIFIIQIQGLIEWLINGQTTHDLIGSLSRSFVFLLCRYNKENKIKDYAMYQIEEN